MSAKVAPAALCLSYNGRHVILASPTGAAHMDKGLPCQDACMAVQQFYKGVPYTVLAVADGHGSEKYTRSEIGAHLAMLVVRDVVDQWVLGLGSFKDDAPDNRASRLRVDFEQRIGKQIPRQWREAVIEHASKHPEDQVEAESEASISRYGTTVALCILYEQMLLMAAIGDSSLFVLRHCAEGIVVEEVFTQQNGNQNVGLATDSLSSPQAAYACQTSVKMLTCPDSSVAMVLLTTDGMTDSLREPERSVRDIYDKTMQYGLGWLQDTLPKQLRHWSEHGVGDDMGCVVFFLEDVDAEKESVQEDQS
ncbi:MAG: protein phosphatase 2C domain-containing protein [Halothiobacillaceae bacterium]